MAVFWFLEYNFVMFGIQKGDHFYEKVLKTIIFISIFLSPLLFSLKDYYYYSSLKYTYLALFSSISLGSLFLLLFRTKVEMSTKTKILLGSVSLYIVWLFITSLTGLNFSSSFWSSFGRHSGFLTYFFSYILFVSALFVYSKETIWQPMKAFVLGGVVAGLTVYLSPVLFNVQWDFLINSSRAGTFGNTTYASIFLGFSIFFSLILFFKTSNNVHKTLWFIAFLFLVCNPVFINLLGLSQGTVTGITSFAGDARAGFLSIAVGLVSSLFVYFSFSKAKFVRICFQIIAGIFLVLGLFFVSSGIQKDSKVQNYLVETGDGARLVYWDMALQAISQRPLVGYGLENYGYIYRNYFDPVLLTSLYPNETWTDKPHNAFLEIAVSSGFVGLVLFFVVLGYLSILLMRKGLEVETPKEKMTTALFFGLIISHLLQIFFAFETISSIQAYFITLALISVWVSGEVRLAEIKTTKNPYTQSISILVVVILMFVMVYNFSLMVSVKSRAIRNLSNSFIQERTENLEKDLALSPVGKHRTEAQFLDFIVGGYQANWSSFDSEIQSYGLKELKIVFGYVSKLSDKNPKDARLAVVASKTASMIYTGTQKQEKDMLENAKQYALRVISITPRDEIGYLLMKDTYLLEGNEKQSYGFEEMSRLLNPESPEYN